ncbi:MAG: ABC transporter ATP-binding protein [Bacillota bacterium]|nr:ABC transporter ATP-binding protein [Bacillota bacterium]
MSFIVFNEVRRDYIVGENVIKALDGVSFTVDHGTFNVVLGQSGAGKTTVLNLLGGMDSPTGGKITVDGEDITGLNERALTAYRRNKVGFVFQFYNLVPNLTAYENVELGREICENGLDSKDMLRKVGLSERIDNFPSQMSGGEQQRVSIARALAKNPKLLLCDEPTGALDSETGRKVLKLIRDVAKDLSKTVVVVTHNAQIAEMADTVIHMKDGRIAAVRRNERPKDVGEIVW